MIAGRKLKLGVAALIIFIGASTSQAQVTSNLNHNTPPPNSGIFRVQDLSNQTKMRMAFARMLSIGALKKYEREDQNEEGIFKSTRALALIENVAGAILITATEADDEDKFATAQLRIFRLTYKDNNFSLVGKAEVFDVFNYGKIVQWEISNDFADHPVATFLEHGGGSGCFSDTLNLMSIMPSGTIRTQMIIASQFAFNGKSEDVSGEISNIEKNTGFSIKIEKEISSKNIVKRSTYIDYYIYDKGLFRLKSGESKISAC